MTNEQKSSEIAGLCHHCLDKDGNTYSICTKCKVKGIYYSCIEMAEWKDQQFKELLYKWLNDDGKIDITKGSIDELLKEIDNE